MHPMSDDQLLRYARNILLDSVDIDGQQTLLDSTVLVVGVGGLGSPIVQYLAAAGVGHLILVDGDCVEMTNLQRQVIHTMDTIGSAKVESAAAWINSLNPDVHVTAVSEHLSDNNIEHWVSRCDIAVIGTDNFASRYALNRVCRQRKIPMVTAAAIGLSGQLTSFDFKRHGQPCFACLYPQGEDETLTCATAGVLGPVVGTVGSMAALEVVKILLDLGSPLFQQLLTWDAKEMVWQKFSYTADAHCETCGEIRPDSTESN